MPGPFTEAQIFEMGWVLNSAARIPKKEFGKAFFMMAMKLSRKMVLAILYTDTAQKI